MLKTQEILNIESFILTCKFNNGEIRKFDIRNSLDITNIYVKKLLNEEVFKLAKIGDLGQVYWDNIAEMKDYDGTLLSCEYDISPEFMYHHSSKAQTKFEANRFCSLETECHGNVKLKCKNQFFA